MVNASDVGKAINPQLVVGQIEGAVVQAHGYALTEDLRWCATAGSSTRGSRTYLIPGIGDIPEHRATAWCSSWPTRSARGARGAWPRCR